MAIEKTVNIDVVFDETSIENFNKSVKETSENVVEVGKAGVKSAEKIDSASKDAEKSVGGIGRAFKNVGTAIKAAGIGLLLAAFSTLKDLVSGNQASLDFFTTTFNVLSIAFNDFVNFIDLDFSGASDKVSDFFTTDNLKEFGNELRNGIIKRFHQLVEALGFLASAAKKFLSGDFSGALEDAKTAGTELFDVITGEDGGFKAVTEFVKGATEATKGYASSLWDSAAAMTSLSNAAQIASAQQQGLIEKYDIQAEQQRQIRDNVNLDLQTRVEANNKLGEILEEQFKAMTRNANMQLAAAQQEFSRQNNLENEIALIEAKNEVLAVEAQITGFRSEQDVNRIGLINELRDLEQSKGEAENARMIDQLNFEAERIENEELRIQALKDNLELEKTIEEERLLLLVESLTSGTQAKLDAEQQLFDAQQEFRQRAIELEEEEVEIKQELTDKKLQMTNDLTKSGADAVDALAGFVEEETALGKTLVLAKQAALTAQLIIDIQSTISSAKKAVTEATLAGAESGASIAKGAAATAGAAPFPANIPLLVGYAITAAGIIASVASAVRKSKQAASSVGGGGGGGGFSAPKINIPSAAPNFNVVGSGGTNQIAEAIGGANQQPVKAYVVSGEVTTQQALDRNIQDTATL